MRKTTETKKIVLGSFGSIKETVKTLSKEEQQKVAGGNEHCYNMQGQYGICKTDVLCDMDIPWCEAI